MMRKSLLSAVVLLASCGPAPDTFDPDLWDVTGGCKPVGGTSVDCHCECTNATETWSTPFCEGEDASAAMSRCLGLCRQKCIVVLTDLTTESPDVAALDATMRDLALPDEAIQDLAMSEQVTGDALALCGLPEPPIGAAAYDGECVGVLGCKPLAAGCDCHCTYCGVERCLEFGCGAPCVQDDPGPGPADVLVPVDDVPGGGDEGIGGSIVCWGDGAPIFPEFDRTCGVDGDCAVAVHQADCCGSRRLLGIASAAVAAFDEAEAVCRSQYPACGCAASPDLADDGKAPGIDGPALRCVAARCETYVP